MSNAGACKECDKPNTGPHWCKECNAKHFQENFPNWTSGNDSIDKYIQDTQLSANLRSDVLEWIPYDRFENVEHIANGGFGNVYKTKWFGFIQQWDINNKNWKRMNKNEPVALKSLNNSENITLEFINEITLHHKYRDNSIIRLYGITQDPETKNYMIVSQYAKNGSLRNYLDMNKNYESWNHKIRDLYYIVYGLSIIHEKGIIHRDLHIGNTLKLQEGALITDIGLCKPADYVASNNTKNDIFGVLPYVAPEILRGQSYTKAADIYSFGIIMYELVSGLPPFCDISHDRSLAIRICKGLRPMFNIKVPQSILTLIKKCLDANPSDRPTADKLKDMLQRWFDDIFQGKKTELEKQIKEAETQSSSMDLSYERHPQATYTSRLLDFGNLPEPENSSDYFEQGHDNLISEAFLVSLKAQFDLNGDAEENGNKEQPDADENKNEEQQPTENEEHKNQESLKENAQPPLTFTRNISNAQAPNNELTRNIPNAQAPNNELTSRSIPNAQAPNNELTRSIPNAQAPDQKLIQINDLQSQLDQLKQKEIQLQNDITEKEKENQELTGKLAYVQSQLDAYKVDNSQQITNLQSQLEQKDIRSNKLLEDVAEKEKENQKLTEQITNLQNQLQDIAEKEKENQELTGKLANVQLQLDAYKVDNSQQISQLEQKDIRFNKLLEDIAEKEKENQKLTEQITNLQNQLQDIAEKEKENQELTGKLANVQSQLDAYKVDNSQQITNLQSQLEQKDIRFNKLLEDIAEKEKENQKLTEQITNLQNQLQDIAEKEKESQELTKKLASSQAQNQELTNVQAQNRELTEKLANARAQLVAYQKHMDEFIEVKTEVEVRKKYLEELETREKGSDSQSFVENERKLTRELIKEKQNRIEDLEKQVKASQEAMNKSLETTKATINTGASSSQEQQSDLQNQLNNLREENRKLAKNLKNAQAQLQKTPTDASSSQEQSPGENINQVESLQKKLKKRDNQLNNLRSEYDKYKKQSEENKNKEKELAKAQTEIELRSEFLKELEKRAKDSVNNQSLSGILEAERKLINEKQNRIDDLKGQVQASREIMDKSFETIQAINTTSDSQEEEKKSPGEKINEGLKLAGQGVCECLIKEAISKIPILGGLMNS